ncbi:MAG: DUF3025 domain-containing protein [Burkholderiales bacterium]|nr:DUF3025 domain-containing protein [Burkholderiales bacterium]
MDAWRDRFADTFPLLQSLRSAAAPVYGDDWPSRAVLQQALAAAGVLTASGLPLRLVAPAADGLSYEVRLYERGELEFRERSWHDLFNVLVWLAFPRAKAALNARHHAAPAVARGRGPVRDALTLFDESGMIVLSADADLADMLRGFRWKEMFWTHRARVADGMQFLPFGHALCEKVLAPYKGITGRCLLFRAEPQILCLPATARLQQVDVLLAAHLADPATMQRTQELAPLPLLGIPGWCGDNGREEYYDDRDQFRPGRLSADQKRARLIHEGM